MSVAQPIPLLFTGETGSYFGTEYEGLPNDVHPAIQDIAQSLNDHALRYLGKLTCSQFSQIDVYAYATVDRRVAVTLMAGQSGLSGVDCVCKFADGSFLTTTTTQVLANAYDEQRLFRVSMAGMNAAELFAQHLDYVADFETRCGEAQSGFEDLLSIAQLVDEYTLRQQSNSGHFFLQWSSGMVQGVAQGMASHSDDQDFDDDDDEKDYDRIEYDESKATPLIKAILQNDRPQVEQLLQSGAEVDPKGWDATSPIVAAVYVGDPEMIQRLVEAGANVHDLDFGINARPIGMAIKQDRSDLVKLLLDLGASPEDGDLEGIGLSIAIQKNNLAIFQMLLEAGADPNSGMEDDYRVIMEASSYGQFEMVQMLVSYGADVSAWSQGETAIMSAAAGINQEIYDFLYPLVDEETRAYADKHGKRRLENAIKSKARKANKLSERLGAAAMYGQVDKVKRLLAEGTDGNVITECGKSPMMLAAMYGHFAVIETLLDAGCDPNLAGDEEYDEGKTALMYLVYSSFAGHQLEVIKLLFDRGADLNQQDPKGRSALILAVANSNTDAVKALIDLGADVNLRDHDGNTAMMLGNWAVQKLLRNAGASEVGLNEVELVIAAREGDMTKLEQLLNLEINVNYFDGRALVQAAGAGHLAIVDRLIQAGCDVNLGWKTGFTPIAKASYQGDLTIVERLLAAGANPFQRNHDGESHDALEYAELGSHHKGKDHAAIVSLLSQLQR